MSVVQFMKGVEVVVAVVVVVVVVVAAVPLQ
jgi:hypothetical protein